MIVVALLLATALQDAPLDAARAAFRVGDLAAADAALDRVGDAAPAALRAQAALLRGNVAYERGRYEAAAAAWRRARDLDGAHGPLAAPLADNLALVEDALARRRELAAARARLQGALAGAVVVALLALAALYRMSSTSSIEGTRAR